MVKKAVYTRQEACELLGISEVTFTAWVKKGLLKKVTSRGAITVTAKSVNAILNQGKDVAELTAILERERKELQDAIHRLKHEKAYHNINEIELELKQMLVEKAPWLSSWTKKAANILIPKTALSDREKAILLALFGGGTLEVISESFWMTRERARQVAEKALRRLCGLPELFDKQNRTINELKNEVAELTAENKRLMEGILAKKQRTEHPTTIKLPKRLCSIWDLIHLSNDEHIRLVPARPLNALPALEIENIYQLVWISKLDVLKCRNMGKKSLSELDQMLESYGLKFGSSSIDSLLKVKPHGNEECVEIPVAQLEADMLDTWRKFRKLDNIQRYKLGFM